MHPVLFDIKGFKIYTYGPIMAIGFLAAFFLIYHIARRRQEDVEFYMDLYVWLILFGLLGAKILYNITEYHEFLAHPIQMMNCRNGGLVWYGGVILDTAFVVWYARRHEIPFLQVSDTLVAPLALGLAIGRWGCLMGGCCYGKPCSLPWAIIYPAGANPVAGMRVHPSPIYESIISLIICGIIYLAIRRQAKTGIATAIWFTLYPLARFLLEFLRGDEVRGFVYQGASFSISTSQFIGLIVMACAIGLMAWIHRHPAIPLVTFDPEAERAAADKARQEGAKKKKDAARAGKSK
jgi:phosphatidylglycerol:prolipoprotein diacylglycerol transferase